MSGLAAVDWLLLGSLAWEHTAPSICGATITVRSGELVAREWWIRDPAGRLTTVALQQPGHQSWEEERFGYDPTGRLAVHEEWRSDLGVDRRETTTWAPGRLTLETRYARSDSAREQTIWTLDSADRPIQHGSETFVRDAAGRAVAARRGAEVTTSWSWSEGRVVATQHTAPGLVLAVTFDARGDPLTATSLAGVAVGETVTFHRDCAGWAPPPGPPG